jgi:hypothetical protein
MNIRVHIERLILDGLPVTTAQGPLVQAAVESELARLFGAGGLAPGIHSGLAIPSASGGTIPLAGENNPTGLGHHIARAVRAAISHEFPTASKPFGNAATAPNGRTAAPAREPGLQRITAGKHP